MAHLYLGSRKILCMAFMLLWLEGTPSYVMQGYERQRSVICRQYANILMHEMDATLSMHGNVYEYWICIVREPKKRKRNGTKRNPLTLTYVRSVSTSSNMTLRNFSASLSCRDGVSITFETDDVTDPVGLDFLVSCGERQNPVTFYSHEKEKKWLVIVENVRYYMDAGHPITLHLDSPSWHFYFIFCKKSF